LATTRFDLVLLDCQMPVLDGWETARQWRQREAAATPAVARLPIVALTANAAPGDRERCLQAGMDDYLAKPLTLETLAECLARYLPAAR
jgi:CheY-like chemotaxis protein